MEEAVFPDGRGVRGRWRVVALAAVATIAAAALGNLVEVISRLGGGLDATIGLGGMTATLVALALGAVVLRWLVRRPSLERLDAAPFAVGLVLLVGLRAAAVLLTHPPLIVDWLRYHELAVSIAQGGDWFATRPSGYSLLLAVGYRIFGAHPLVGEWLNVALGMATGLLIYGIAVRAAGSRAAGVALTLYAIAPAEILMTPVLGTEIAYGTFIAGAVWLLLGPATPLRWVLAGALLAASQYIRATSQLLAPVLAVASARLIAPGRRLVLAVVLTAAFVVVLAPVVAGNLAHSGTLSLSTSSFAAWQLLIGTNQQYDGRFNAEDVALVGGEQAAGTPEAERIALRVAVQRITSDPIGTLGLLLRKFPATWGDAHYGARWALYEDSTQDPRVTQTLVLLSQLAWALTAALAAVAVWVASGRAWRDTKLLAVVVGCFVLIHALGEANPRYHAPLVPISCVLAGIGLAHIRDGWNRL